MHWMAAGHVSRYRLMNLRSIYSIKMSAPDNHHGARKLRLIGKMKDRLQNEIPTSANDRCINGILFMTGRPTPITTRREVSKDRMLS